MVEALSNREEARNGSKSKLVITSWVRWAKVMDLHGKKIKVRQ